MSVLFYAIRPCNDLDTIVANGRKQTVLHLFLDAALKTVAYLRVSTRSQDLANQKLAILEFSQKRRFPIDQFIESRISSRKSPLERRIDEMLGTLEPGDRPAGQRAVAARPQPLHPIRPNGFMFGGNGNHSDLSPLDAREWGVMPEPWFS